MQQNSTIKTTGDQDQSAISEFMIVIMGPCAVKTGITNKPHGIIITVQSEQVLNCCNKVNPLMIPT